MQGDVAAADDCSQGLTPNWSDELEQFHEESSRSHFIDVHTRWALLRAVERRAGPRALIADVGCSSGYLLEDLRRTFPDTTSLGTDIVAGGLRRARANDAAARLVQSDCTRLPFASESVDAAVSANVLEHVRDDGAALREFFRVLRPGGLLGIVVPANPNLFDAYDEYLGHERRYRRGELAQRAGEAGFSVLFNAHLGSLVYPPFWFIKKRNRRQARRLDVAERRTLVQRNISSTQDMRIGHFACALERRLLKSGVRLPFGIRAYCVLQKPS